MDLKKLKHKPGVDPNDWTKVSKKLLILLEFIIHYCRIHKLPIVITSIIRPKIKGVSVSNTHSSGRACDISVKGWTMEKITDFCEMLNEHFTIGAVSLIDKKEHEAVYEPDEFKIVKGKKVQTKWAHIHIQVRP